MSWTHNFDEDVASEYGVSPAVMIAALQRWIRRNRANEKNLHDDRTWTYNSWRGWAELFPFWTADQVRRILEKLIELKILRVGNFNKTGFDRTTWYAFEDEEKWVPFGKSAESHSAKLPNGNGEKAEPIPPSSTSIPPSSLLPTFLPSLKLPQADPKPMKIPRQTAKAIKKENTVRKITDYYQELFVEEYEAKPTWDGKIMKLVHADVARLGDGLLGKLIQIFFEDPGSFVEKNGTGLGYNIFHSQIDRLLEKRSRMEKARAE
jgi:hypothetical protein